MAMSHCTMIAMRVWVQDVYVDKDGHQGGFMVWLLKVAQSGGSTGLSPEGDSQRVVPQGGFTIWFPGGGSLGWFPKAFSHSGAIGWLRLQPAGPKLVTVVQF